MASNPFVLDDSVLCGWFLANRATDYGDAVAKHLAQNDAHAPWLLQLEFTNVLRTAIRRGHLEISSAREVVDQVALLPIRIDPSPPAPAVLPSLALRLQRPIATRDEQLIEAAWAAGVGILTP